jgi:hypothetical protein
MPELLTRHWMQDPPPGQESDSLTVQVRLGTPLPNAVISKVRQLRFDQPTRFDQGMIKPRLAASDLMEATYDSHFEV